MEQNDPINVLIIVMQYVYWNTWIIEFNYRVNGFAPDNVAKIRYESSHELACIWLMYLVNL